MSGLTFALTVTNLALFAFLAVAFMVMGHRSSNRDIRMLAPLVAGFFILLVSGSSQRVVLQAMRFGWTHHLQDMVIGRWTQIQVVGVIVIGSIALAMMVRIRSRVERAASMAEVLRNRVRRIVPESPNLTSRELDVVQVMAIGLIDDDAIAARLDITPNTAATHVRNIMGKTGVKDRHDMVLLDSVLLERETQPV